MLTRFPGHVQHPATCTHQFWCFDPTKTTTFYSIKMKAIDRLAEALAECDLADDPNYADIARRFNLVRSTLWRRHVGRTRSRAEFLSQSIQCLNRAQEEELLRLIQEWTRRRMPPTPQIVRNLAEEIIQWRVGKNWTSDFVRRHRTKLTSVYLRNMDHQRIKAESVPYFEESFRLVESKSLHFSPLY